MGNWLSDWIDTRSGANLKIDADAQQGRFNTAMKPVTEGMAEMKGIVKQQMDPNSSLNQNALATSKEQSADDIAEANRLAGRNVAMGGGNATAASFLSQDAINNMTGKVYSDFQNNMNNRTEAGLESLSGIYSNLGSIAQAGFNMNESALASNKMIDRNATIAKGNMLGGALKIGGGLLSGNPMMALSGAGSMLQEGGPVGYNTGGQVEDPENPKPVGNGTSDEDSMLDLAMQQRKDDANFMYWKNARGYEEARSGEKFKGFAKGMVGGNLAGTLLSTVIPGARIPATIAGGLYGRYKGGKNFEEEHEEDFSAEDRARVKEIRQRRKEGYQKGGQYSPLPGDIVDAKLEPGEYVLNRNAVNTIGKENLDEINEEISPRFPKQNPDDDRSIKMRMGGYLYG
tara:strand:- start:8206 stop:9405 length:1200 start_codon:yes stop_codon:yes gene_type:complete